ncbi:uncharacterized protein LOC125248819 [Megalobrama amblycephala]|uniref:uncharacterized protein LOC125248819 n=1 Tax=Megalobrama amblycephala TaxID=75352 RepID=UPI0020146F83|nr:uncharacterized protein LOC125248819 [Megalobrama amblycephala]
MWYLVIVLIFTVYGTYGCVITSPDQKVNDGTDVYLSCNFFQCPGHLDVMSLSVEWEFQNISQTEIILYYISNKTVSTFPGVMFCGDVKMGSFDIHLPSVTRENNGTYLCRLRLSGRFFKNYTHLIVQSAQSRRNSPGVIHPQAHPLWWLTLVSVAAFVLLIGSVFFGRRACRSIQKGDDSKQNMEEVKTRTASEDMGITYKVGFSSMPVLADVSSPPNSPDNIYITMHSFPFTPDAPVTAGHNRRLPSDWQPENEEPVYAQCH